MGSDLPIGVTELEESIIFHKLSIFYCHFSSCEAVVEHQMFAYDVLSIRLRFGDFP